VCSFYIETAHQGYKNTTLGHARMVGWLVDSLPYLSWAGMVVVFLTYVVTHGAGLSNVITVVFFAALALNTG
jgi:hypothetical protein